MLVLALVDERIFFPQRQNLVIFVLIIRNFKIQYSLILALILARSYSASAIQHCPSSQLLVRCGCVYDY